MITSCQWLVRHDFCLLLSFFFALCPLSTRSFFLCSNEIVVGAHLFWMCRRRVVWAGYETTDGSKISALYYNTLFYGGTTRMSPLVGGFPIKSSSDTTPGWTRNTCKASNGNTVSSLGSSYCLTGGTPGSYNFGHAITGNKYGGAPAPFAEG
jgi:hypothetical protein